MHRVFCAPSRYVQGEDVSDRLAVEMAVLGLEGPVLVVGGRSAVAVLAPTWAAPEKDVRSGQLSRGDVVRSAA